jgi:tetratricopeptide (TPR) repeat protein
MKAVFWQWSPLICSFLLASLVTTAPAGACAQDEEVVKRIITHGKMRKRPARSLATKVSDAFKNSAAREDSSYDSVRQAVGEALFGSGGPGRTMDEYNKRLARVRLYLYEGLTEFTLEAVFRAKKGAAEQCVKDYALDENECYALIAAATKNDVDGIRKGYVHPEDPMLQRARLAFKAGDFRQAAGFYQQLIGWHPVDPVPHSGLGAALLKIGDPFSAAAAFSKAISFSEPRASLYANLGRAYYAAGKYAASEGAYKQALAIDPKHAGARKGLKALSSVRRRSAAVARAGQPVIVGSRAQQAAGYRRQAEEQLKAKRYLLALRSFRKSAEADPGNPSVFARIGEVNLVLGYAKKAAVAYEKAVELSPDTAEYHANLGLARAKLGELHGAKESFMEALKLEKDNEVAGEGLEKLGKLEKESAAVIAAREARAKEIAAAQEAKKQEAAAELKGDKAEEVKAGEVTEVTDGEESAEEPAQNAFIHDILADPLGGKKGYDKPPEENAEEGAAAGADAVPDDAPEKPSKADIAKTMKGLRKQVKGCVPKHKGVLMVNLTVQGASGTASNASVDTKLAEEKQGECITGVLKTAKFPVFKDAELSIKFPYKF